jgi:hypothetical protein
MVITIAVAELVTHQFVDQRMMTDKLIRRGLRIEFDTEVDPFRTSVVGHVADPLPDGPFDPALPHLHHTAFLRDAVTLFLAGSTEAVVVDKDGEPMGLLHRTTIEEAVARRLAEQVPQPPSLLRGRRSWRIRRLEETHAVDDPSRNGHGDPPGDPADGRPPEAGEGERLQESLGEPDDPGRQ